MTTPNVSQPVPPTERLLPNLRRIAESQTMDVLTAWQETMNEAVRVIEHFVFVPGLWVCPQCGFQQGMLTISAHTGNVWPSTGPALPCPNDGEFLRRVTWRENAEDVKQLARPDMRLLDDLDAFLRQCAQFMPEIPTGITLEPGIVDGEAQPVVHATVIGPCDLATGKDVREALRAALESQR